MCDCLKSTGSIVSEERSTPHFNKLEVSGTINVFITQDTFRSVKVEAGKNLIKHISTEVKGGVLVMKNNNRCNFVRSYQVPINVFITADSIVDIIHRGSGRISSTNTLQCHTLFTNTWSSGDMDLSVNVNTGRFNLHVNSGDVNLRGFAWDSYIHTAGNGFVNAGNLQTDYTHINGMSTGETFVKVAKEFYPQIKWTGNVHYSGDPYLIDAQLSGKGQLIKQ